MQASQGQDTASCGNGRPSLSWLLGNMGRIGDRKEEIPGREEQMGRGRTQLQARDLPGCWRTVRLARERDGFRARDWGLF